MLAVILSFVVPVAAPDDRQARKDNKPGWPDVFIHRGMYDLTFEKPVVGPGEKPETYSQKAIYMWLGGRYEQVEVTLARDPAFKDRYSPEVLKKEKNPPQEREVNKKKAWLWEFPRRAVEFEQVVRRLVVLLDADKAMVLELKGSGSDLEEVARQFDFAKVEKALASPPKR